MTPRYALWLLAALPSWTQPKPVPRMQAIPMPYDQVSFQRDGRELARYHFGQSLRRPFVFPVIGPSGLPLTRMGHPGDPISHSHHNSVWIAFGKIGDTDFWTDRSPGRILHERMELLEDGPDSAFVIATGRWVDAHGEPLLQERRKVMVEQLAGAEWRLVFHLVLEPAAAEQVTLAQAQFGPMSVRMAKTIGVHHGGGTIRNSEGAEGEPAIFHKRARWVDYSGPTAPGVTEGITLMDHPVNPRHPAHFHVREDGWMGALLTEEGPLTVKPGAPLVLRYGMYVHAGAPPLEALEKQWQAFARAPIDAPVGPPLSRQACMHGDFRRYNVPRAFKTQAECVAFVETGK